MTRKPKFKNTFFLLFRPDVICYKCCASQCLVVIKQSWLAKR